MHLRIAILIFILLDVYKINAQDSIKIKSLHHKRATKRYDKIIKPEIKTSSQNDNEK